MGIENQRFVHALRITSSKYVANRLEKAWTHLKPFFHSEFNQAMRDDDEREKRKKDQQNESSFKQSRRV
jgi:hypothetical protein